MKDVKPKNINKEQSVSSFYPGCGSFIKLTTGAIVDITANNVSEATKAVNVLIDTIVAEHFSNIIETFDEFKGDIDPMEIFINEIDHLLESELTDHEHILGWFLTALIFDNFQITLDEFVTQLKKKGDKNDN